MLGVREESVKSIFDILKKGFDGMAHRVIKYVGTKNNYLDGLWIGFNIFMMSKVDRLYLGSEEVGRVVVIDGGIMIFVFLRL